MSQNGMMDQLLHYLSDNTFLSQDDLDFSVQPDNRDFNHGLSMEYLFAPNESTQEIFANVKLANGDLYLMRFSGEKFSKYQLLKMNSNGLTKYNWEEKM